MSGAADWRRIEELCHGALEREPPKRDAFLSVECAGDEELRREVESLLAREPEEAAFLGGSTLQATARAAMDGFAADRSLIGRRLGAYDVAARIGAGGMGVVYKARDRRLDRVVAIKVLSPHLTNDAQFRARLDREARAIAALTHPHICTLYDVGHEQGNDYLVLEYLDGQTLATRLQKGALPLDHALRYAIEIADALDKAHRAGIIHRDLKPGNIMITKAGAKLLDCGLAKTGTPTMECAAPSSVRTTPTALTEHGTILGTLQYAAPEQLEGKEADARTDIFAFGAVLYEMVTGRRAFDVDSQVDHVGAILERDPPPVSTLRPASPPALDAVIKRCLAKDPDERWQSAGDLAAALKVLLEPAAVARMTVPVIDAQHSAAAGRTQKLWIAIAGLGLTTIVLAALQIREHESVTEQQGTRFTVSAPEKTTFATRFAQGVAPAAGSISPDGRKLAFTAVDSSRKVLLWVRPLDSLVAQRLPDTDGATLPFWSTDSRWIGFFADARLKKVDSSGGVPQTLCEVRGAWGGAWNPDDIIVFAAAGATGSSLYRVSSTGGEPFVIRRAGSGNYQFPHFLPDGHHLLYYVSALTPNSKHVQAAMNVNTGVHLTALDAAEDQRLLEADSAAIYAAPGYLLFVRQGTLFAQSFNTARLQLEGQPARLAESVPFEVNAASCSVSDDGVLTYRAGPVEADHQLAWFDRTGKLLETVGRPGDYIGMDLSPDGHRVAVHLHEGNGGDAWVLGPRDTMTRLTFDPSQDNSSPIWSPDGRRIVFSSLRNGKWGLYEKASDGTGTEELIVESALPKSPMAWTPHGNSIIFVSADPRTGRDQWLLPMDDARRPVPLLNSPFNEDHPQVSPNGRWLAYVSNHSGPAQVYVKPFPSGEGRWPVSVHGGWWPRWRRDGKEIFYLDDSKLMAVAITASGSRVEAGEPRELFDSKVVYPSHSTTVNLYAVSADGQRFLIPIAVSDKTGIDSSPITVILNWTSALKRSRG